MTTYPARIDNTSSLPAVIDGRSPAEGSFINNVRTALLAVESELGVKPSSVYATVRARLDAIENSLNNIQAINLGGDIGGTTLFPKVIGIQGRPVSSAAPGIDDVLTWNGITWLPRPAPGGGSGVTFSVDLSGNNTAQTVVGLQGRPLISTAPSTGQSIVWSGSAWVPNNISQDFVNPAFVVTLIGGGMAEVGQNVGTPLFNATYNYTPITAVLTDSDGNAPQNVIGSPTVFHSLYSFVKNTFGATVLFTLTANNGLISKFGTATQTWGQKLYWGVGAAGQSGAAFIQALSGQSTTITKNTSFTVSPNSSQKIYFAHRTAYGTATFTVGGFSGGFAVVSTTISVTNAFGFAENYTLYESDNLGLGSTTVTVT
jgi:hypothetical protein